METTQSSQPRFTFQSRQQVVQFFVERLDRDVGLEMMLIPAGVFVMGSPEDELERLDQEGPQHEVRVSSFFMGKYPVTQAQWRTVAAMPKANHELKLEPSHFKGDQLPVEQISWYDAVEFCARLSAHTGRDYHLPTEAEWEYACRARTATPFHFGETITTDLANYQGADNLQYKGSGSYGRGPKGEYRQKTTPVNQFAIANAFGLCDMHGNVWEWCGDHWHDNYKGAPADGSAWSRNDDSSRVLRGGCWFVYPGLCRSAYRAYSPPNEAPITFSLRVVCRHALLTP